MGDQQPGRRQAHEDGHDEYAPSKWWYRAVTFAHLGGKKDSTDRKAKKRDSTPPCFVARNLAAHCRDTAFCQTTRYERSE